MNGNFRKQVRDHIEARSLREEQMARLQTLLDHGKVDGSNRRALGGAWFAAVVASCAAVTVLVLSVVWPRIDTMEMAQRIADEVARNHLSAKPLEVRTDSLAEVRRYFDKLDFAPVQSERAGTGLALLGGRYCSLRGLSAAQLRMRDVRTGTTETLYETPYRTEVFGQLPQPAKGEPPIRTHARGVEVTIWVEKGLVFALARGADRD